MINWNIKDIPNNPGIYFFKDKNNIVIYVGKSKNLKNRIKQYQKGTINSFKTKKMIKESIKFDYIITKNRKRIFNSWKKSY